MSIYESMNKENLGHTYNGMLFNFKKEENPAIWDNIDKPGR